MKRGFGRMVAFWRNRRGNMAVMTALMMPALVGAAGLISDTIQWSLVRRTMQRQADSGALAGVHAMAQAREVNAAVSRAMGFNNNFRLSSPAVIESPPTEGGYAGDSRAVRVVLVNDVRMPFAGAFFGSAKRISVEAVAAQVSNGSYCALALDTAPVTGIIATGNSTVNLNCGMFSNAPATVSVDVAGSTQVVAAFVGGVGGVPESGRYAAGTVLNPYSTPQPDPFAGLPDPDISNAPNDGDVNSNQVRSLGPGNYRGMDIKGTANLSPGVYYIDGAGKNNPGFTVGAQGVVNCTGCTIVLTSTTPGDPATIANANINGNATLNMTAPTSGSFQGVIIYRDRRATSTDVMKINGTAQSRLLGAIYVPRGTLEFQGTAGMDITCLQLVGQRITFTGNSTITNNCPANSGASAFTGRVIRLVG